MIDIEPLVIAWLNDADPALGAPAATKVPDSLDDPFIRVTLIDSRADRQIPTTSHSSSYLQVDVYAGATGGQVEAKTIARAVVERLHAMPGTHAQGVVSAVTGIGARPSPDPTTQPARDRYLVTCDVYAHE